jgi:hypothetical protein
MGGTCNTHGEIKRAYKNLFGTSVGKNTVRVIKSRRMRWVRHVARMVEGRDIYRVLVGRPEGKGTSGKT